MCLLSHDAPLRSQVFTFAPYGKSTESISPALYGEREVGGGMGAPCASQPEVPLVHRSLHFSISLRRRGQTLVPCFEASFSVYGPRQRNIHPTSGVDFRR